MINDITGKLALAVDWELNLDCQQQWVAINLQWASPWGHLDFSKRGADFQEGVSWEEISWEQGFPEVQAEAAKQHYDQAPQKFQNITSTAF